MEQRIATPYEKLMEHIKPNFLLSLLLIYLCIFPFLPESVGRSLVALFVFSLLLLIPYFILSMVIYKIYWRLLNYILKKIANKKSVDIIEIYRIWRWPFVYFGMILIIFVGVSLYYSYLDASIIREVIDYSSIPIKFHSTYFNWLASFGVILGFGQQIRNLVKRKVKLSKAIIASLISISFSVVIIVLFTSFVRSLLGEFL